MLPQVDFRIPLRFSGVFSYFESQSLTNKEIEECETMDIFLVTLYYNVWYLHFNSYAEQKENFLYFRVELKLPPETK